MDDDICFICGRELTFAEVRHGDELCDMCVMNSNNEEEDYEV